MWVGWEELILDPYHLPASGLSLVCLTEMAEGPRCKQKNARPLEAQVQVPSLCRPKQVNEDDEYEYILSVEMGSREEWGQ